MSRALVLGGLGGLLLLADLLARPWRPHVTVVTGTTFDPSSWVLGPLVIVLHLLAALAPILLVAALADVAIPRRRDGAQRVRMPAWWRRWSSMNVAMK